MIWDTLMKTLRAYIYFYVHLKTASTNEINEGCDFLSEATYKQCYVKESLARLVHSPNQLAVDNLTNTLYFSFDFGHGDYLAAALKLDTQKLTVLKGIKDAFAITKNPETGEIYFGGSHGIYKYNSTAKSLKRLKVNNLDIWWMVVKKWVYFVKFPSLITYRYVNKNVKVVHELRNEVVNQFVFNEDGNIIFINSTGVYGIKTGDNKIYLLKDNPKFLGLATDNAGHVYLCNESGIYMINRVVHKVKKIVNIPGVLGMAFDKDNNIIYSDSHELIRLRSVSTIVTQVGRHKGN